MSFATLSHGLFIHLVVFLTHEQFFDPCAYELESIAVTSPSTTFALDSGGPQEASNLEEFQHVTPWRKSKLEDKSGSTFQRDGGCTGTEHVEGAN